MRQQIYGGEFSVGKQQIGYPRSVDCYPTRPRLLPNTEVTKLLHGSCLSAYIWIVARGNTVTLWTAVRSIATPSQMTFLTLSTRICLCGFYCSDMFHARWKSRIMNWKRHSRNYLSFSFPCTPGEWAGTVMWVPPGTIVFLHGVCPCCPHSACYPKGTVVSCVRELRDRVTKLTTHLQVETRSRKVCLYIQYCLCLHSIALN